MIGIYCGISLEPTSTMKWQISHPRSRLLRSTAGAAFASPVLFGRVETQGAARGTVSGSGVTAEDMLGLAGGYSI
jgi:hypothetical protein